MAVLVWSEYDDVLGNSIRSGRRVSLSAEEYRAEAEALDMRLDTALDMASHTLTLITRHQNGWENPNSFEQVWVLGRAVNINSILRHEAMLGETRNILWQALTAKAWYGIRHNLGRAPNWRKLIPHNRNLWKSEPQNAKAFDFLEVGYWLSYQQLHDAGEVFGWKFTNAREVYVRPSLRSVELRRATLYWLRRQTPEIRDALVKSARGKVGFELIPKALQKRFPAKGPGSALLPQHYSEYELRAIVCETLDAARDLHFPHNSDRAS